MQMFGNVAQEVSQNDQLMNKKSCSTLQMTKKNPI